MYKRAMIFVVVVLILTAAVLICVVPRFTKVDIFLNATKFSAQGETVGTYEIAIHGNQLDYIFGDSALDVNISAFDSYSQFEAARSGKYGSEGLVHTEPGTEIFCALYSAWNTDTDTVAIFDIYFSPDLDRWLFLNVSDKLYYVASASGSHTTQELVEYFSAQIPINWRSS